jgi:DNA-binding transcriptional MocR family regulator
VADFHNPTGLTMAAADRAALALACARAGVVLVADETMAELRLDGRRSRRRSPRTTPGARS